MHVKSSLIASLLLALSAPALGSVIVNATTNNGSFETPAADPNYALDWSNAERMSSYGTITAHDGDHFVRSAAVGAGSNLYIDTVNSSLSVPVNLANPIELSAWYLDPNTGVGKYQYAQYVVRIAWDAGGSTYSQIRYTGWTGIAAAADWANWSASLDISGLTSGGHAIADGTNWRLTRVQIRDVKPNPADGVSYERLWDLVEVSQVPEPATLALLGLGGLATLLRRRR